MKLWLKNFQQTKVQEQLPSQANSIKHLRRVNTYPSEMLSVNCRGRSTSFFFFFSFIFIIWRLVTLQCCSGFCHTLTWISHTFTCVQVHFTRPPSPWYQNQTKISQKKRKSQANITDEHRQKTQESSTKGLTQGCQKPSNCKKKKKKKQNKQTKKTHHH